MIHDVKDDPILQDPSQEPSTSSKYGLQEQGFLTLLIILENWNFAHKWIIIYYEYPWCQGWPHPPRPQSGTIYILQVWTSRMEGSWHTSNHARELKVGTQVKKHISWQSIMSRMTPTSKFPVRNHQHPPSIDFEDRGFLDTLLFILESWNFAHKSRIPCNDNPWYQKWPHLPSIQLGTINIFEVWTWRMGGS